MGKKKAKKSRRERVELATAILLALTAMVELATAIIELIK